MSNAKRLLATAALAAAVAVGVASPAMANMHATGDTPGNVHVTSDTTNDMHATSVTTNDMHAT